MKQNGQSVKFMFSDYDRTRIASVHTDLNIIRLQHRMHSQDVHHNNTDLNILRLQHRMHSQDVHHNNTDLNILRLQHRMHSQDVHHNNNEYTDTSWYRSQVSINNVSKQSIQVYKVKLTKQSLLQLTKVPAYEIQGKRPINTN